MKLFLICLLIGSSAHSETQVFEAVAKYEGQIAYVERHTVIYDQDTLIKSMTEYVDSEGRPIGTLQSDFTHSIAAPDYIFRDKRHQSMQGLRWNHGQTELFSRDKGEKKIVKKVLIPGKETMIGGEGLIYYIADNLQQIIAKKGEDFQFVVPGRLETFNFFIEPVAHNSKQAEFEIHMKSWLMKYFSPRLKLIYDLQKKRLKSYEGLSNLRDRNGEMMSVDIQYLYEN